MQRRAIRLALAAAALTAFRTRDAAPAALRATLPAPGIPGRVRRGHAASTSGFLVGFLAGEPVVLDIAGLLGGAS